jgi:HSP20 family protein
MSALVPSSWFKSLSAHSGDDFFTSLRHEVDRVFDDFGRGPAFKLTMPRINVSETDGAIEVEAELPGVDEKDVDLVIERDMLTIKGEKKTEREEKKKDYFVQERAFGSFARSLSLPFEPDPKTVKASFAKGVLKITLPKTPGAKEKAVKIPVSAAS